jgi:DNA-directed RNA polymerase II subunit RPB2
MRMCAACNDTSNLSAIRDGGSFIINGLEKVLTAQETLKNNYIYIFKLKEAVKSSHRAEIRSNHLTKIRSTSTLNIFITTPKATAISNVTVVIPFIKYNVPLTICFRMLDIADVAKMLEYVTGHDASTALKALAKSVLYQDYFTSGCSTITTAEECFERVGVNGSAEKIKKKRVAYVKHIMQNEFFPHCCGADPLDDYKKEKAFFLGLAVRKLLRVYLEELPADDIDSYVNKRVSTSGALMALLTRQLMRNFVKTVHIQVFKAANNNKFINMIDFFSNRKISAGLKFAMATGTWGISRLGTSNQAGVCQVLNTMNIVARLSQFKLVNTPINRDAKNSEPRLLHASHFGLLCAAETPEGRTTGLLNSLTLLARVRVGSPAHHIIEIIVEDMDVIPFRAATDLTQTMVMVDGIICGFTSNPVQLQETYRKHRRWYSVPVDSSISYQPTYNRVCINADSGDLYRPLICLEHVSKLPELHRLYGNWPHVFWHRLLIEGVVEFINKEEEHELEVKIRMEDTVPAKPTHAEVHPGVCMYGIAAGTIVFSDHNQAPRNIYSSAMMKQSVACQQIDFHDKFDKKTFTLNYAQRAVVSTWTSELVGVEREPAGQACVVAILCYSGYNQEDSIIVSRAALQRGLFQTSVFRTFRECETTHGADTERFGYNPNDPDIAGRQQHADYSKVSENDGVIEVGSKVDKNTVLISKTIEYANVTNNNTNKGDKFFSTQRMQRDRSVLHRNDEPGRVEKVMFTVSKDGLRCVNIRTQTQREPEVGDKLASKNGQKGVIGAIMAHEDLPFTASGIVPDLILNPHAIPSRMTLGQILESLLGKAACLEGEIADGTPHRGIHAERQDIKDLMRRHGMDSLGEERMYNGATGEMLKKKVFIGVTQYQRLKHCVSDKIHGRGTGPRQILTRQPVEGRSRLGGFRMGEMERDALVSHGASSVMMDRFLHCSDNYEIPVCTTCGYMAEPAAPASEAEKNLTHRKPFCRLCQSNDDIVIIDQPYSMKLLSQELNACHIGLKYTLSK